MDRKESVGTEKDISKEACWESRGGSARDPGLCPQPHFRDCIRPDQFMAKLLSDEGYHRYISMTGGAWGKKAWHVQVRAEY